MNCKHFENELGLKLNLSRDGNYDYYLTTFQFNYG